MITADSSDDELIDKARKLYQEFGKIEIDADPGVVSRGSDDGAYVQAWVWVPFKERSNDA